MSRDEEFYPKLRLYEYTTNDGRTGQIAAHSELDAKIRVARNAIVTFPLEVEQCQEIEKKKGHQHHE